MSVPDPERHSDFAMSQYNVSSRRTKVARNEKIHPSYVILHVDNDGGRPGRPGQFAMLRLPGRGSEPFMLSRPFSIMDEADRLLFLIRIVGKGSGLLASLDAGDELEILSPLGSAFPDLDRAEAPLCVAGGCGVAPFLFLARREKQRGKPIRLLYGAAAGADLVMRRELEAACTLDLATDDGSVGRPGLVTELLRERIEAGPADFVAACGPTPMLREVARICRERSIPCVVSVETVMGCGFGACLGCAVPRRGGGYLYACQDGPVLPAEDIDWTRW